ncbi:MAG: hypothetical protein ACRCUT_03910, partial [Spirochaetota bacterium]
GAASPAVLGDVAVEFVSDNTPVMSSTIPVTHVVETESASVTACKTAFSKDDVYERILSYYNKNFGTDSTDTAIFYGMRNKTTGMVYISYVFAKKYLETAATVSDRGKVVAWRSDILLNTGTGEFSYRWGSNPISGSGSTVGGGSADSAFILRNRGWSDKTDDVSYIGEEWHVISSSFVSLAGEGTGSSSTMIADDLTGTTGWDTAYNSLASFANASRFYLPSQDYPADLLTSW